MHKIEFNDEMTLESIKGSFKNLELAGLKAYIIIDDEIIDSDDEDRDKKIECALRNHVKLLEKERSTNNHVQILKNPVLSSTLQKQTDLFELSNNVVFIFQLGTVLKYAKSEYYDELKSFFVKNYAKSKDDNEISKYVRYLNYISELVLILKCDCSDVEKGYRIQNIINRIGNDYDEQLKFKDATILIKSYIVDGNKLSDLLYDGLLNQECESATEELKNLIKKNGH